MQEAAKKYLDLDQRVVVWSVPGKEDASQPEPNALREDAGKPEPEPDAKDDHWLDKLETSTGGGDFSLKKAQRVVLPNGLILLLFENRRLPIVVADAFVRQVRLLEPEDQAGIATLTGMLLSEGTPKHTGPQIAELIENVGGTLSFDASGGALKVLSVDRKLGLGLLFECLMQSNFPQEAFARERAQLLSSIADAERRPEEKALNVFRALAYGKHPLARPSLGTRNAVEALGRADCLAFHRKLLVPNNIIVSVVGDFDSKELIEEVTRLTADWKAGKLDKPAMPAVEKPEKVTLKGVTMPEAAQLHFFLGHAGIRRNNPDYYKLLVMDYVLGRGPGFTDRLSARLRDREGLAYTVNADITGSAAEEPGLFAGYIGTQPQNLEKAKRMFLEEINRIRDEKPTAKEVADAESYLIGSLAFRLTSNDRIAEQLVTMERYQLGFDHLAHYRKAIAAVTPEQVQAVARKHLDPERLFLVVAGPVDRNGKPLGKSPPPREKPEKEDGDKLDAQR